MLAWGGVLGRIGCRQIGGVSGVVAEGDVGIERGIMDLVNM